MLGYGGNASPFPSGCAYPPGYATYTPSLVRVEQCTTVVLANLVTQAQGTATKCGLFSTGCACPLTRDCDRFVRRFVCDATIRVTHRVVSSVPVLCLCCLLYRHNSAMSWLFWAFRFAGTFYDPSKWVSVLDLPADGGANVTTPSLEWPVAYIRGDYAAMQ